ncbi:MAG: cysteine--tRNA ligase [Victivallales bacterium]|nr:cysteine--tRNA ligase [Victivallales bacterium]
MTIYFFNTMDRVREEFTPVKEGQVGMYTCGPTVYNYAHIGNFRAYIFEDLLRRTLEYHGYRVTQVMNLTDVDDKTIRDSRAAGLPLAEFTAKYKQAFFEDLKTLRIEPAEHYPAATAHIPEMIALIQTLMDRGFAYQADDDSIYFSIAKCPGYGKLARIDLDNQQAGVRINADEYAKDAVADFALWKAWDEKDGDVWWDSPWGRGRPGWHIECSAMSMKYLGKTFDIHTGGIDNMFPHHEDEIAQSESANGCRYVNYWLHCAHLMVDGDKMSKSAGNFHTLRDLSARGFHGNELRWVLLGTHYRKKLNFTFEAVEQARISLQRFRELFRRLQQEPKPGAATPAVTTAVAALRQQFAAALADDLNVSEAFSALFGLLRESNRILDEGSCSDADAATIMDQFHDFNRVLDVLDFEPGGTEVPAEIMAMAEKRQQARKTRDFATADAMRDQLKTRGWVIEDSPNGWRVKPL